MSKKISLNEIKNLHGGYWRYPILDFYYLYNPFFPSKRLVKRLQRELPKIIDQYPSTHRIIARSLSKWKKASWFNEENLILGNGSSELIRALNQIIGKATIPVPTFNEYVQLPREKMNLFFLEGKDDFRTNVDELIKSVKKSGSDFLIINNPNNPVGNTLERGDIKKLLETEVFVVVDEAFIDFCREKSVEDLIEKYDNLIVINSCSKSMGFPGLRLGYLLTKNKKIKEKIKKILPIWNINSLTEVFIEIFPEFKSDYEVSIKKILAERKHLFKKLKELKFFKPFESQANFIFCETRVDNKKLAEFLYTKHNILIKTGLNQDFLPGDKYIRIGIRTREDNKKIINALKTFSFKH